MRNTADDAPVTHRSPWLVGTLSLLSAGLYNIYLLYVWAREINGLTGTRRYSPKVVLVLMVLTLGLAGTVYECFYAIDLQKVSEANKLDAANLFASDSVSRAVQEERPPRSTALLY